jgi:hypothetical protein
MVAADLVPPDSVLDQKLMRGELFAFSQRFLLAYCAYG